jgi:hypothetical protein
MGVPGEPRAWLDGDTEHHEVRGVTQVAHRHRPPVGKAMPHGLLPHATPWLEPLRDYPPFRELMRPKG